MAETGQNQHEPLTPDEVAGWLGVSGDEGLVVQPERLPSRTADRRRLALGCGRGLMVALGLSVGLAATQGNAGWLWLGFGLGAVGLLCFTAAAGIGQQRPWTVRGEPIVTADAFGMAVVWEGGKHERFDWTEVVRVEPQYGPATQGYRAVQHWLVQAERGRSFHFPATAPHAERLADTLLKVVDARSHGRPLWDRTVSARAGLSRMTGDESDTSSERGVSRLS